MTLEITPETQQLVKEEIQSDRFQSVDELIVQGVYALRQKSIASKVAVRILTPR